MNKPTCAESKFPQVYVVEASAGSGKTYCLAKHYLKLLLSEKSYPQQIENILAITFTNKAARQMKERIWDLLKKIALDKFENPKEEEEILSAIGMDKKGAKLKTRQLMDYIIANYNFFQVETIDSFINMILLSCAWVFKLSSRFKINDDTREYLRYSLDECIDLANKDKKIRSIFDNFLKQYIYLEGRRTWMPKEDILNILESMLYHANVYGGSFLKFDLRGEDIFKGKKNLLKLYQRLNEKIPQEAHGVFRNSLDNFVNTHSDIFDFADIANKKTFVSDEILMTENKKAPSNVNRLWKKIRQQTTALAEKEARAFFNLYVDIFNFTYQTLRKLATADDVLFLEELNQQARSLINKNGVTVPELYYRLSSRLRHFLIDEFQDTSLLQWQNLYPLIEEALSTGGSLFYVGDKKQAIFRFRGGEAALFRQVKNEFKAYVQTDYLHKNYRSQKAIVEFNNTVFGQDNLKRFLMEHKTKDTGLKTFSDKDIEDILAIFSAAKQEYEADRSQGYVSVSQVEYSNSEDKIKLIKERCVSLIEQLISGRRFRLRDIAILCRSNKEVEQVSGWLIEKNIAVESEKTLNIKNNQFIKELISFLSFLNSPIDNLSFAAFILGEIFLRASRLDKEEIAKFLFEIRQKVSKERAFYIYREFRRLYKNIWESYIEEFFSQVSFIGLYELIINIFEKFKVFENFPEQQGFFMHFLELICLSEEDHQGLADFLEYFEDLTSERLYVNSSDADCIRVMTVHKAKGLGFGVVILPFLEINVEELGTKAKRGKVSYIIERKDEGLSLLNLDKKYAQLSDYIASVFKQEYKRTLIDELNIVYVALTRAENELYIFIPSKKTNNIVRQLIPEEFFEYGSPAIYRPGKEEEGLSLSIRAHQYKEWQVRLNEENLDIGLLKNRKNILRGEILHTILSCIGNLSKTDFAEVLKIGLEKARVLFPALTDFSEYKTAIFNLISAKEVKDFFYAGGSEVHQEKEVVDRFGNTKRIDRLIIKDDEVWIIDYKTKGESVLDYKEQLNIYMGIAREIYPKKKIRGFVIFIEEVRIEEING